MLCFFVIVRAGPILKVQITEYQNGARHRDFNDRLPANTRLRLEPCQVIPAKKHKRTHIRDTGTSPRLPGVPFAVITDGAEGGEQRSNAPENSRVTMETWDTEWICRSGVARDRLQIVAPTVSNQCYPCLQSHPCAHTADTDLTPAWWVKAKAKKAQNQPPQWCLSYPPRCTTNQTFANVKNQASETPVVFHYSNCPWPPNNRAITYSSYLMW